MQAFNKTLYIHGFLGEPDEIPFLQGVDLYKTMIMNDEETLDYLKTNYSQFENVIGYSMGGRFILSHFQRFFSNFKQIHILSSHFGLSTSKDKLTRSEFGDNISSNILKDNFLNDWNDLELFNKDPKIEVLKRTKKDYQYLFDRYRLEKQGCYIEEIESNQNIKIYLGEYDKKYHVLYQSINKEVSIIKARGHRLNNEALIREILNGSH